MLMAIVGSALGAWWVVTQQQRSRTARASTANRERGTVIFVNTPQASDADVII
jgi:hypothetical protein